MVKSLEEMIRELPPEEQEEVREFVESILMRRARKGSRPLRQDWAGALKEHREEYNSLELQNKALDWRGDLTSVSERTGASPNLRQKEMAMTGKAKKRAPEIVLRDGKPAAVILDIQEYQDMLERLEDLDDLKMLEEMRTRPLKFRKLEDFLAERVTDV